MATYVRRTAVTRLSVTDEQRQLLEETITEWRRGCQDAVDSAWGSASSNRAVQSLAYDVVREQTALGSQHSILATHQAAEAIRSSQGPSPGFESGGKPTFTAPTITYDARTMTFFDDETVSLSTTENRVRCPLVLPDDEDGYQYQYLNDDDWEVTESTLTVRDGEFFLHIGFRRHENDVERDAAEDGTVLGVDLGVENIAVTSTATFFDGREFSHKLREFERVRADLQQTGTRSAHRTLENASGRQMRYVRDVVHRVAKGIVAEAQRFGCDVIAFEELTGIRDRTNGSWGHEWAFAKLLEYVEYKAESAGILAFQVDPENTSVRCSECGFTKVRNRQSRSQFQCGRCDAEANADYNAAKNIGLRYVRRGQQSSRRRGDSQLALKSGTVTVRDGFDPYPDGFDTSSRTNSGRERQRAQTD